MDDDEDGGGAAGIFMPDNAAMMTLAAGEAAGAFPQAMLVGASEVRHFVRMCAGLVGHVCEAEEECFAYICNNSFVLFPMPQVDGGLGDLLESFQDEEMRSLMLQAAAAVQVSAWGAVRPMSTAASISGISGGGRDGSMLVIGFICYGLCDSFKFASYCHVF